MLPKTLHCVGIALCAPPKAVKGCEVTRVGSGQYGGKEQLRPTTTEWEPLDRLLQEVAAAFYTRIRTLVLCTLRPRSE